MGSSNWNYEIVNTRVCAEEDQRYETHVEPAGSAVWLRSLKAEDHDGVGSEVMFTPSPGRRSGIKYMCMNLVQNLSKYSRRITLWHKEYHLKVT
jgi:hypothetical protein